MKGILVLISLLMISCSSKGKKDILTDSMSKLNVIDTVSTPKNNLTFEATQDSLRMILLNSKSNTNLKSSLLQELYIRGLVNQIDDKIKFKLPFNLHSFDCGAPDCYSTDITFDIPATAPVVFPTKINFNLLEHGCGIEKELSENGTFELVEHTSDYVNYYSKKQQSNLVILGTKKQLYYFPDSKPNSIKAALIDKLFEEYDDDDLNAIVPYQSTVMYVNEYESFMDDN